MASRIRRCERCMEIPPCFHGYRKTNGLSTACGVVTIGSNSRRPCADSGPTPMPSPFVHLHVQSMYSLYDSIGSPEDIVARAKELGYDAIALTDRHALYGAVEFYEAAHKAGIKPIIGVLLSLAPHKHT